ncbi:MAG: efflux RND transporter periplasmic adaptor subunit [Phycisphaerae bacterium]
MATENSNTASERRPGHLGRRLWLLAKGVLVVAVVVGVVYWLRFTPVPVVGHEVGRGRIVAEVMGTGTLETHFRATISPKISGLITEVLVDQGDHVKAGQVLVKLDDRDLKRQVEAAEATVAADEASVKRQEADRVRAGAVLEQAKLYMDRLNAAPAGAVSELDRDKGVEAVNVAQAGVASAEAAILEGRKQLIAAVRTLDFYRVRLSDALITAPFDGLIVRRDRDPGDIVVPGTSILSLISLSEIWIRAWVDETEMARLKPGQPARVVFRSEPDHSYKGEVARLGREVDRETREFVVDVLVRELPKNWAVGQRAEVYIETDRRPDAVILRSGDIVWRDSGPGVFVEQQGHARWRPVRLGLRGRETVEILEGLRPGEVVIVPADAKVPLRDGQRVKSR